MPNNNNDSEVEGSLRLAVWSTWQSEMVIVSVESLEQAALLASVLLERDNALRIPGSIIPFHNSIDLEVFQNGRWECWLDDCSRGIDCYDRNFQLICE